MFANSSLTACYVRGVKAGIWGMSSVHLAATMPEQVIASLLFCVIELVQEVEQAAQSGASH